MGAESRIGWTDATFNPWRGCTKVSEGCAHCYAEVQQARWKGAIWGDDAKRIVASEAYWKMPVKWNSQAEADGRARLVFCASLADVFEPRPDLDRHRDRLARLIHHTPWLIWLLLTKRPEHAGQPMISERNVWLGITVENVRRAEERMATEAARYHPRLFLSCEPLLEDLGAVLVEFLMTRRDNGLQTWIIAGGESGAKARPMAKEWAAELMSLCQMLRLPFFFKQSGGRRNKHEHEAEWAFDEALPFRAMIETQQFPDGIRKAWIERP